jgi:predicted amidophosphoribosyltransferase
MAKAISKELGVIDLSEKVKKLTPTKMKHEEPEVSPGIYQVEALGKLGQVLLVDDLYRSGATLESVAVQLRSHAVREVIGFCATKVRAGLRDRGD